MTVMSLMYTSWKDGLAYLGILRHYLGDEAVPGYLEKKAGENELQNLTLAMKIAEDLGIFYLMEVEDYFKGKSPEPKSVQAQVIEFYKYFGTKKPKLSDAPVEENIPSPSTPTLQPEKKEDVQGDAPVKVRVRHSVKIDNPSANISGYNDDEKKKEDEEKLKQENMKKEQEERDRLENERIDKKIRDQEEKVKREEAEKEIQRKQALEEQDRQEKQKKLDQEAKEKEQAAEEQRKQAERDFEEKKAAEELEMSRVRKQLDEDKAKLEADMKKLEDLKRPVDKEVKPIASKMSTIVPVALSLLVLGVGVAYYYFGGN